MHLHASCNPIKINQYFDILKLLFSQHTIINSTLINFKNDSHIRSGHEYNTNTSGMLVYCKSGWYIESHTVRTYTDLGRLLHENQHHFMPYYSYTYYTHSSGMI